MRAKRVLGRLQKHRSNMAASSDFKRGSEIEVVARHYEHAMVESNTLDFHDFVSLTIELFSEHPHVMEEYRRRHKVINTFTFHVCSASTNSDPPPHRPTTLQYVLVDEFQDTSHTQFELLTLLAGEAGRITVVGDDDQAIYGFQGASTGNFQLFQDRFSQHPQVCGRGFCSQTIITNCLTLFRTVRARECVLAFKISRQM